MNLRSHVSSALLRALRILRPLCASVALLPFLQVPLAASAASPPTNVLLITADSLRPDRLDLADPARFPALARLAREGTTFRNAWTVSPWTAPALVSIFTGLHPSTHGVEVRDDTTPVALPTLPRLLATRGVSIANFGFFAGASYYRNLGLPEASLKAGEEAPAAAFRAWLTSAPRPFFAWIHAIEPHLPYGASGYAAAEAAECGSTGLEAVQRLGAVPWADGYRFDAGDRDRLLDLYDADLFRLDAAVGELLAALDVAGLADSTLVLFTADHGEELLEHGFVGHASTSGDARLTPELLRIPWLLRGPGVPAGRLVDSLVQNVDVTPTLLDLLGVPIPSGTQGLSAVPLLSRERKSRRLAFFSTSIGGHRTPVERRSERLFGVTDGRRLHVERAASPSPAGFVDSAAAELAPELDRFRREQAKARLALLEKYPGETRPTEAQVATFEESLAVSIPSDRAELRFDETGGAIRLSWESAAGDVWIEYDVGTVLPLRGAFHVTGDEARFGPFPAAYWNDLASHSPFRFRVLDRKTLRRSAWRTFTLRPVEGSPR